MFISYLLKYLHPLVYCYCHLRLLAYLRFRLHLMAYLCFHLHLMAYLCFRLHLMAYLCFQHFSKSSRHLCWISPVSVTVSSRSFPVILSSRKLAYVPSKAFRKSSGVFCISALYQSFRWGSHAINV